MRQARLQMVAETIVPRPAGGDGDWDPRVLDAMRKVPRHAFVPDDVVGLAYEDRPAPIGLGQTISQPYIVAFMTDLVRPAPGERVLDVGTGSGYQAAVLAELARDVTSLEILCPLADRARATLTRQGYGRVLVRCADGWKGAPDLAPFDVIVVAAAPEEVPPALLEQLAVGGRLVIPVGTQTLEGQVLLRITRRADGTFEQERTLAVRFVPMTGGDDKSP
ncbi:MAG: protein-L-isoaspartate(D-aspartate) O-methyltransferase [Deltaproteobacteria bacterium]|nr:protein-L-isoaspartate(D-aspartate) O-methyltransferase [Deltaproteobacteria bacterium]